MNSSADTFFFNSPLQQMKSYLAKDDLKPITWKPFFSWTKKTGGRHPWELPTRARRWRQPHTRVDCGMIANISLNYLPDFPNLIHVLSRKRTGRKCWKWEAVGILLSFMMKKKICMREFWKKKKKKERRKKNKERMERINKLNLKSVSPTQTK